MIILLLTLLGIALTITFAGFLLSSKMSSQAQQEVSYTTGRNVSTRQIRERSYVVRSEMLHGASAARSMRDQRYIDLRRPQISTGIKLFPPIKRGSSAEESVGKPTPWVGIILILLALFGFCCFALNTLLLHPGIIFNTSLSDSATATVAATTAAKPADPFIGLSGASKALNRVYQLDPAQYATTQEYNTWAYATCSAASMTEVINAYGHHYRLTDILNVESHLNQITPDLGLLEPTGIDTTVAKFGFKTVHLSNSPLDRIIQIANQGRPVIVSFPPSRWPGGHILVVRGGTGQNVYLADSSRLNMQVMPRATFLKYWAGFAVAAIPA